MPESTGQDVPTYVTSFEKLARETLKIPEYQRGFVWHPSQLTELAEDLRSFAEHPESHEEYYMGTILLHCREGAKEIIDGQQRITALSILYYQLKGRLPQRYPEKLCYSRQSKEAILKAHKALDDRFSEKFVALSQVFQKIKFTVVEVTNLDQAFSFFDTQNNRGVPLHATDLMKAYHLRHLDSGNAQGAATDELQRDLVHRWLQIQNQNTVLSSASNFAHSLFENFLWRGRRWHGADTPPARHAALLEEFQNNCRPPSTRENTIAEYPIYPGPANQFATGLQIDSNGALHSITAPRPITQKPEYQPFSLRQPLFEGAHFFLFAEKYAALVQKLAEEKPTDSEINQFRTIDRELVKSNSPYLRRVFMVASLLFLDQFGTHRLTEFALWLECLLGAVRLNQARIVFQTASKFVTGDKRHFNGDQNIASKGNLYDLIAHSFDAEQVIEKLRGEASFTENIYANFFKESTSSDSPTPGGVQERYKRKLLNFYSTCSEPTQHINHPARQLRSSSNVSG